MELNKKTLKKIWAQVPPDYYHRQTLLQKIWHERKWQLFRKLLSDRQNPKNILEVGCSSGHLTGLLARLYPNAKTTGIDVYSAALKEARKRYPQVKFIQADAHKLPFKKASFDMILCSETIEHVVDPLIVLTEIRRVLKPNGIAIIEMDSGSKLFQSVWWVWTKWGKGKVWHGAHLHPFPAAKLEETILKSGLKIQQKVYSHLGMAVTFLVKP